VKEKIIVKCGALLVMVPFLMHCILLLCGTNDDRDYLISIDAILYTLKQSGIIFISVILLLGMIITIDKIRAKKKTVKKENSKATELNLIKLSKKEE